MATTYADITSADDEWTDLVAEEAALANVPVIVQNKREDRCVVWFGGASAPVAAGGVILGKGDVVAGTAAKIWVKALDGDKFTVGVTLADT